MPRFAANLTMMFNEVPFLDRFDAAAKSAMVSRSQATWLCERRCASSTDAKVLRSATLSISAARFGAPSPKFFRTMCSK